MIPACFKQIVATTGRRNLSFGDAVLSACERISHIEAESERVFRACVVVDLYGARILAQSIAEAPVIVAKIIAHDIRTARALTHEYDGSRDIGQGNCGD